MEAQQWIVQPADDGWVRIMNVKSGLYLTARAGQGRPLTQEPEDSHDDQFWKLQPIED